VNKNDKDWQNSLACAYVLMFVDLAMNPIDHPHGGKKYGKTFCHTLGFTNKKEKKLVKKIKIVLIILIARKKK
jgi:ribosomal protein L2